MTGLRLLAPGGEKWVTIPRNPFFSLCFPTFKATACFLVSLWLRKFWVNPKTKRLFELWVTSIFIPSYVWKRLRHDLRCNNLLESRKRNIGLHLCRTQMQLLGQRFSIYWRFYRFCLIKLLLYRDILLSDFFLSGCGDSWKIVGFVFLSKVPLFFWFTQPFYFTTSLRVWDQTICHTFRKRY